MLEGFLSGLDLVDDHTSLTESNMQVTAGLGQCPNCMVEQKSCSWREVTAVTDLKGLLSEPGSCFYFHHFPVFIGSLNYGVIKGDRTSEPHDLIFHHPFIHLGGQV